MIVVYIAIAGLVHYYWAEKEYDHEIEEAKQQTRLEFAAMESDLIRNVLSKNYAALYASLNYQKHLHKRDWSELTLYDENNQRIYPLSQSSDNTSQDRAYLLYISYTIEAANVNLGRLDVQVNWRDAYQETRRNITQLESILLGSILILILLEYYWNKKNILDPLIELTSASKQLSIGNYLFPLQYKHNDELGQLTIAFDAMRNQILKDNKKLLLSDSVFRYSHQGIIVTDEINNIIDANPSSLSICQYTLDELKGLNLNLLIADINSEEGLYDNIWQGVQKNGIWKGELWFTTKSRETLYVAFTINSVYSDTGKILHYVAVFTDITHLKEYENELSAIAFHDALTGLPNRFLLEDRVQQATAYVERHETLLAICFLDLDGFKSINDSYGHNVGDQILIEVAQRMQNEMRDHDTVSRIGGDEFVLLLLDLHNVGELEEILRRVLNSLAEPYQVTNTSVIITASIGISLSPFDESNFDTLLHRADQAMYIAKIRGKNQYSFDTSMP